MTVKSDAKIPNIKPSKDEFREEAGPDEDLPLALILRGLTIETIMFKIKSLSEFQRRKYYVDFKTMKLHYFPSNKTIIAPEVNLRTVVKVQSGWQSDVFIRIQEQYRKLSRFQNVPHTQLIEDECFSVVLNAGYRTINLVAPNRRTRNAWVKGLNYVIEECRSQRSGHKKEKFDRRLINDVHLWDDHFFTLAPTALLVSEILKGTRKAKTKF